jgi:transcriptional regulator with XRE-family HTH domain
VKITTIIPTKKDDRPQILDDRGRPMSPADGLRAVLAELGWTQEQCAKACGLTVSSVEKWIQTNTVPVYALNLLREALENEGKPVKKEIRRKLRNPA